MNFQNLSKIDTPDNYLDMAFKRAKVRADITKQTKSIDPVKKARDVEASRINTAGGMLTQRLTEILVQFPSMENLPEFYKQMISATLDYPQLKKSLGALNWARQKIISFTSKYGSKISVCKKKDLIMQYRREHYGRVSSIMKQIKKELEYLEHARKTMKGFPSIKSNILTVAVCGFPNIGKTTLLSKLTTADPEINEYSFTTKGINVGYLKRDGKRLVQLLDTPGTLNRFEKMNSIEQQAYIAIRHAAHIIIYIFDLTEPFPLKDQKLLLKNLRDENKEIILYLSKTDILDKNIVDAFLEKNKAITSAEEIAKLLTTKSIEYDKKLKEEQPVVIEPEPPVVDDDEDFND